MLVRALAVWVVYHSRRLALCALISMWVSGGVVLAETQGRKTTVDQEHILITLPVYISSLIATAGFTWVVARYDAKRSNQLDDLRRQLTQLQRRVDGQDLTP